MKGENTGRTRLPTTRSLYPGLRRRLQQIVLVIEAANRQSQKEPSYLHGAEFSLLGLVNPVAYSNE